MRIANRNARGNVLLLQPFKGNNLSAERKSNGDYVVYSYGWYPIFVYKASTGTWYENGDGYSRTTRKHISQTRPYCDTIILGTERMKEWITTESFVGQGTFNY